HGFGGSAVQWEKQMRFFSDENRVIAIDLRGHGYSSAPNSSYSMDEVQADLDSALAKLNVPEKFVLAGHSFGGAIAATYAERNPQRGDKLILIATAGEFTLNFWAQLAFKLPVATLTVLRPIVGRSLSAPLHTLKSFHNNNMAQFNGWSMFRNITVPTLVITGHRDRVFSQAVFEEVAKKIPNAQHVAVPASAHMVILERAEAVNRAIQRFINEAPARRGQAVETARTKLLRERRWLKHYEEGVPFTISLPDRPVHRFLRSAARRFPNRVAIKFYGRSITYRALSAEADRFANALRDLGVQRGDRVMILLPNIPQTVIAYYGILRIGAVVVFTSPTNSEEEIIRQVKDSGAKVLIGLGRFAAMIDRVQHQAQLDHVIITFIRDYLPSIKKSALKMQHPLRSIVRSNAKLWS
ncbi:MAG TPA: alpha/beta fold hydrolase, partial [Anaerolineae bacterium]|nr:alpha/beta fold hydrolase [Anaerolineae bacterium]